MHPQLVLWQSAPAWPPAWLPPLRSLAAAWWPAWPSAALQGHAAWLSWPADSACRVSTRKVRPSHASLANGQASPARTCLTGADQSASSAPSSAPARLTAAPAAAWSELPAQSDSQLSTHAQQGIACTTAAVALARPLVAAGFGLAVAAADGAADASPAPAPNLQHAHGSAWQVLGAPEGTQHAQN